MNMRDYPTLYFDTNSNTKTVLLWLNIVEILLVGRCAIINLGNPCLKSLNTFHSWLSE